MPIEETMKEQIRLVLETGDFQAAAGMAAGAAAYLQAMGSHTFVEVSDEDRARIESMKDETLEDEDLDEAAEQHAKDEVAFAQARARAFAPFGVQHNIRANIVDLQHAQGAGDRGAP
jgi:hypothetical protein